MWEKIEYNYNETQIIDKEINQDSLEDIELLTDILNSKKSINIETIIWLSQVLKDWLINEFHTHKVSPWENIWRIIYERTWISMSESTLKNIKIKAWDEVVFVNEYIIIRDSKWVYFRTQIDKYEKFIKKIRNKQIKTEVENRIKPIKKKKDNNLEKKTTLNEKKNIENKKNSNDKSKLNNLRDNVIEKTKNINDEIDNQIDNVIRSVSSIINENSKNNENSNKDLEINQNLSYDDFLKLDKDKRFQMITKESNSWYYKIVFPNQELAKKVTINDIIPEKYEYCEIIRDREYKLADWKKAEKNYFDIVKKDDSNNFKSIFIWKQYDSIVINNWFLIKPNNYKINDKINTIYDSNDNDPQVKSVANNEKIIRNLYTDTIKEIVSKIKKPSAIDEKFIFSIIAEESKFNPNAISHTWVRWLWQIREATLADILIRNANWWLEDKIKQWSKLEDILLYNDDLIETSRKLKVSHNWWKINYSWVDTELYHPEISIKWTINYLLFLESLFIDIDNLNLRRYLITASYNMGAQWLKDLIKQHGRDPQNLNELMWMLKNDKEPKNYVARVNKYYQKQKNFS